MPQVPDAPDCGMRDPMSNALGTFTDYASFVALLRARKVELGLSDLVLDELAGLAGGHSGKVLGPSQVRGIGPVAFDALLRALGLSGTLYADPAKAIGPADRRQAKGVRNKHRVGKEAIRRARPVVMQELARKGGAARWAGSTPEARAAMIARMNAARLAKRRAGTSR
jgi:hypothetical protein